LTDIQDQGAVCFRKDVVHHGDCGQEEASASSFGHRWVEHRRAGSAYYAQRDAEPFARVHAELRARGRRHSRERVARLLRAAGRAPKRWRTTTIPDPAASTPADLIKRDFSCSAEEVNKRWCGDITYINTWEGWLYLATVIDLGSRRVVGWATADHLRTDLIADDHGVRLSLRRKGAVLVQHPPPPLQPRLPQPQHLRNRPPQHRKHNRPSGSLTPPHPPCPSKRVNPTYLLRWVVCGVADRSSFWIQPFWW
jgi:transposase InsO family protein